MSPLRTHTRQHYPTALTVRPGIYICGMCCAWGLVSACTGLVHSYAGLVICRTILGFTEAAVSRPAVPQSR